MMQLANGYIWKLHMDQVKALVEKEEEAKESVLMDSELELIEDCDTRGVLLKVLLLSQTVLRLTAGCQELRSARAPDRSAATELASEPPFN